VLVKGVGFVFRAASYILTTLIGRLFYRSPLQRRIFCLHMVSACSRWALKGLDVQVHIARRPHTPHDDRPHFFVANHVSDIDILALASITPMVFITSAELRDLSFLGTLAKLGGSVFVERRNKFKVMEEMKRLTQLMHDGFDILLFPEGTSSNGESVLPFKNTFFQAAIDAEAMLVPVCINYRSIEGEPPRPRNRDKVFYYGTMGFTAHLGRLLSVKSIEVECKILEGIPLTRSDDRKEMSERAYRAITEHFQPIK
jgi:1-acyl-sn-glycerol-3-phosphate acyltransferase